MKKILVLADEKQKTEWLQKPSITGASIEFTESVNAFSETEADIYFHLDLDESAITFLQTKKPVFINAVIRTLDHFPANYFRLNAWPGFLNRAIVEVAASKENELVLNQIIQDINWKFQNVPDIPGMIAARSICMIINEAFYALGEHVSSKEDIDVAMRLGTNYPYGPFEWAKKIGLKRVYDLLEILGKTNSRYSVAPALKSEIADNYLSNQLNSF